MRRRSAAGEYRLELLGGARLPLIRFHLRGEVIRLYLDEKAHLALVQYQKRVVRQNPKLFGEADIDVEEVVRLAAQVDERLWTKHLWTLREAVAFALDLEMSSAEQHYHGAVKTTDGKISPLLRNLGASDDGHIRALVELGQREGLKGIDALRQPG